jgi:hypothetical protein
MVLRVEHHKAVAEIGMPRAAERVRPHQAEGGGKAVVRRTWAAVLAAALIAATAGAATRGSGHVELEVQGSDGMAVDLSTLSRSAQMQDLAHVGGTAMGAGKGQYDALLSNGPLDPPRLRTIREVSTQELASAQHGAATSAGAAQQGVSDSDDIITPDGKVHLLRSAKQILAGRMAKELEGKPVTTQQKEEMVAERHPRVSSEMAQASSARAVWQPKLKTTLQERAAALRAQVRKLEDAAGNAEISELAGLSEQ